MANLADNPRSAYHKSLGFLVPFLGCLYIAVMFLYLTFATGTLAASTAGLSFPLVATLAFLGSAALLWRGSRIGYMICIVASAVSLLASGFNISIAVTGLADFSTFLEAITLFPALILTFLYATLGVKRVWHQNAMTMPGRSIPASSVLALLALGFVIGGASIGLVGSGSVTSLVNTPQQRTSASLPGLSLIDGAVVAVVIVGAALVLIRRRAGS